MEIDIDRILMEVAIQEDMAVVMEGMEEVTLATAVELMDPDMELISSEAVDMEVGRIFKVFCGVLNIIWGLYVN